MNENVDIPFLFYGTEEVSVLVTNDQVTGFGSPRCQYYFQMWRDIPSHVIFFRDNLSNQEFMSDFDDQPVTPPSTTSFRYDYLAQGEVPPGFWLKFTLGIHENKGFVEAVEYSLYNEEINTVRSHRIQKDRIILESTDFLILLTNISISSADGRQMFDPTSNNVLVDDEDVNRREFNERYFSSYLSFLENMIDTTPDTLFRILSLSGITVLSHLIQRNSSLRDRVVSSIDRFPSAVQFAIIKELELDLHVVVEEMRSNDLLFNW